MKKALVVDDSVIARTVMTKLLSRYAVDIFEATNGRDAMQLLYDNPDIELIFLDWEMPEMSGIKFLHQIREDARTKEVKVVMVTNHNELEDVKIALEENVDEYIMLPITPQILQEKLAILEVYPIESV